MNPLSRPQAKWTSSSPPPQTVGQVDPLLPPPPTPPPPFKPFRVPTDCVWCREGSILRVLMKYSQAFISYYIMIGQERIFPSSTARNIGVVLDSHLDMAAQVSSVCKASYIQLHISRIRKYLTYEATSTLINALVTSKLDYNNSILFCLPGYVLKPLQMDILVTYLCIFVAKDKMFIIDGGMN